MSYRLHAEAERELGEALDFYLEHGGRRVAAHFLDEFERVMRLLDASPGLGSPAGDLRRSHPLRRFPYSLIYRPDGAALLILAVCHQHRYPAYWRGRR